jgi:hypothetical protein
MHDELFREIIAYEKGALGPEQTVEMFQRLIDSGDIWYLQGAYGRQAMQLIRAGLCLHAPQGQFDYFGNYIPSRYEVAPGAPGSPQYQREHAGGRALPLPALEERP